MTLRKLYILSIILTVSVIGRAQFVDIDWNDNDTVVPIYAHSYNLGADYDQYDYDFSMEYIETAHATKAERRQYKVKKKALSKEFMIETYLGVSQKSGIFDVSVFPFARHHGKVIKLTSFKPVINKRDKATATEHANAKAKVAKAPSTAGIRYAEHSRLSTGKWVKIRVNKEGVYAITKSQLSSMGFSNPSAVKLYGYNLPILPETNIHTIFDDIVEMPLWRRSDGSMLFYSKGLTAWRRNTKSATSSKFIHQNNPYSQYIYYFLTEDAASVPASFKVEKAEASIKATAYEHILHEEDAFCFMNAGRTFFENYDYATGATKTYRLSLPNLKETSAGSGVSEGAKVTVQFAAAGKQESSLNVLAGDNSIGSMTLDALQEHTVASLMSRTFSTPFHLNKTNITLKHTRTSGTSGHLDYIKVEYPSAMSMKGLNYYAFSPEEDGASLVSISNAPANIRLWKVSSPVTTYECAGAFAGGNYEAAVDGTANDLYVAVDIEAQYPSPQIVGKVDNQDLHALSNIDLVIIVPANGRLTAEAQRLADIHKEKDKMRCVVVSADKIYNEFSSGTPDATAYRRFMKMLYDKAETAEDAPKNLLLFGDGIWDNRIITPGLKSKSQDEYLLCYESVNSVSKTNSYVLEEYYTLLDDNEGVSPLKEKPDCGVGRIPVNTVDEAKSVVDKLIAYINNDDAGAWQNVVCMLGDDGNENQHMDDAEDVAIQTEALAPDLKVKRIYWDTYTRVTSSSGKSYPDAKADIDLQMQKGALIMNYTGHGAAYCLSHEQVIRKEDFAKWSSPRLPLWVTAACDVSPFDMNEENNGEIALLNPKGGAMGILSTTRTVYSSPNKKINKQFMKYVLGTDDKGNINTVGEALQKAKVALISTSTASVYDTINKCHFVYLGDPAMRLSIPKYKVKIDTFNGKPVSDEVETIGAGALVTVTGHIEDMAGNQVSDFQGNVIPTIYDNLEDIVCKGNDSSKKFEFQDRTRIVYTGNDSIVNGKFTFTFPVPLDYNYSDKSGLINLYAVNKTKDIEANGSFDKFALGGTSKDIDKDTNGPIIVVTLNSETFSTKDGEYLAAKQKVNESPFVTIHIDDKNGINTTGSGIGHDIMLIIDNDEAQSYNLNNYFVYETGSWQKGDIDCLIPTLTSGQHTMLVRAWDILNNPTSIEILFDVETGLKPKIFDLDITSPVRGDVATVTITSDRPQTEVYVGIDIYDMAGRKVFSDSETGVSNTNKYQFVCQLTKKSGRIVPGIYICQVTLSTPDGSKETKAKKFIVLHEK